MSVHPSAQVHPAAIVEPGAGIDAGCVIGPFAVVGRHVRLGEGCELRSHAVVTGRTTLGPGCVVYSFACVGEEPQDLKYRGEPTRLVVGARCRIREGATLNTGTEGGGGITRVGDDCMFMTGSHVGHDTIVGNRVILANQAALGGHCVLADDVIVGGLSGIHQFVRVGRGAIIGAVTMVSHDVMPFALVQGPRGRVDGLNLIGLKRRGVSRGEIAALRAAYDRLASGPGVLAERARTLRDETDSDHVREMVEFILADTDRSFLAPQ